MPISVNVYRSGLGDCTNGGVTKGVDRALLVLPGEDPAVILREGSIWGAVSPTFPLLVAEVFPRGSKRIRAVPYVPAGERQPWFMDGGHFVYTSDSRFHAHFSYPLPVHDRVEA